MTPIEELQKLRDEMLDKTQAVYDLEVSSIATDSIEELASRLQSIIDSMKAQEPVAWMRYGSDGNPIDVLIGDEPMEFIHGRNAPLYAAPQVPEGMVLPCDVRLPPNLIIRKGCKIETLMEALKFRDGRDVQWADPKEAVKSLIDAAEKPSEHCTDSERS